MRSKINIMGRGWHSRTLKKMSGKSVWIKGIADQGGAGLVEDRLYSRPGGSP